MIPMRIYMKGLLCYRGEQELNLADSSVWMLSGPNGSGKSAVFDAVTFALFGCHRGGKSNARELINKDESELAVEFDFLLDGELFRLRRTARKRGVGTRQISHCLTSEQQGGAWEIVSESDSERGFERWVREHVGLTYESFTSSVLLLQGQAERVLSPRTSERREILESIVDLSRYRRLHTRVDEIRKRLKIQSETLGKQLIGIPKVRDSNVAAIQARVATCQQASRHARDRTEHLYNLRNQAHQWAHWQASLASSRKSHEQAQSLLASSDSIQVSWERLQELRNAIPHLKVAVNHRCRLKVIERTIVDLTADEQRLSSLIADFEAQLAESLRIRQSISGQITADEKRLQEVGMRLRELSAILGRSRACEQQQVELIELQHRLTLLPSDAAELLDQTKRQHDDLLSMSRCISPLARLLREREALIQTTSTLTEATAAAQILQQQVQVASGEISVIAHRAETAVVTQRDADRKVTEIRTLYDQAVNRLCYFNELSGQTTCSYCGQSLTTDHVKQERTRLESDLKEIETQLVSAASSLTAAEQLKRAILEDRTKQDHFLLTARERLHEVQQKLQTYRRDQLRHAQNCQWIYDNELDDLLRLRVAAVRPVDGRPSDWLSTDFPTPAYIDEIQRKVAQISEVSESLRVAQKTFETVTRLQDRVDSIVQSIAAQGGELSADTDALRNECDQATIEELSLQQRLSENRQRQNLENATAEHLMTQSNNSQRELSAKQAELKAAREHRNEALASIADARNSLSPDWQVTAEELTETELQNLQQEANRFVEQGIEARYSELLVAQANVARLHEAVVELDGSRRDLPPGADKPLAEIEQLLAATKNHQADCDRALREAEIEADRIVQRQSQRRVIEDEYRKVHKEHSLYEVLTELLGPRKLQRELVRRAEREIVDLANNMLDRVSGGQLELTLAGHEPHEDIGQDKHVLQLEARNRSTAADPLSVAFLSGSQRFRVAVSLALGMGQYASARRRSIQSVIIDEGFGSLDREGRQVMIQELQNLRGHLERIVLVSHQEEFADAFPDGYRFELKNGATHITRYHR